MIKYIVLTTYTWGVGETEAEATKNAKARGQERIIYVLKDTAKFQYVDQLGRIFWTGEEEGIEQATHFLNGKRRKLEPSEY